MTRPDDDDMPLDPFAQYDSERIAKETGGRITCTISRGGHDLPRLTIGAIEHPHLASLNSVAVRIHEMDGVPGGAINLGHDELMEVISGLRQAAFIAWPPPPEDA